MHIEIDVSEKPRYSVSLLYCGPVMGGNKSATMSRQRWRLDTCDRL